MQIITSIADTERLIAAGRYQYLVNDVDTGITEPWTIHQQPDGTRITRVERDTGAHNIRILLQVIERQQTITQFDIVWKDSNKNFEANAHYESVGDSWQISRTVDGVQHQESVPITADLLVFPLMRVFTGGVLQRLSTLDSSRVVLVPNIIKASDKVNLLAPYLEHRTAKAIEQNDNQTVYQYLAENYDDSARFYVNQAGILTRYTFTQSDGGKWDVRLIEL